MSGPPARPQPCEKPQVASSFYLRVCTRNEFVSQELFCLSRYRRLDIVFDRAPDFFAAHIWIVMISIISRWLVAQAQAQQGI
jgi:hypothetical protein